MRYLVKARVKPGRETALAQAITEKTLGRGSVAGDEYLWDMEHARLTPDHTVTWVEVCFWPPRSLKNAHTGNGILSCLALKMRMRVKIAEI